AGLSNTAGDFSQPQVVRIDPSTGATERVVATRNDGLAPCPGWIAVDPLSGDIFTTDNCSGPLASNQITRISDPDGPTPTATDYANVGSATANVGSATGLVFAPDGTLYVAD